MKTSNVRIVSWGGLGDVLLTTPIFRAIKEQWPGSRTIVYSTNYGHYDILLNNPYIDRLKAPKLSRAEILLARKLRLAELHRGPYRLLKPSLFRPLKAHLPAYSILKPGLFYTKNATEIIAEMIGITLEQKDVMLFLTRNEEEIGRQLVASYDTPIAIHITSNTTRNQHWPLSYWAELVSRNPKYTFIQLGLPTEEVIPRTIDLRGKISLRVAFAVLKHVKAFVGVVSVFAHATNAFGTPGVVFYGPSSPLVWGHHNNRNLDLGLACSPCVDILGPCPCPYGAPCMSGISVREVELALEQLLGEVNGLRM
jgi:ADP-heptose:LPS heptosyltransferase